MGHLVATRPRLYSTTLLSLLRTRHDLLDTLSQWREVSVARSLSGTKFQCPEVSRGEHRDRGTTPEEQLAVARGYHAELAFYQATRPLRHRAAEVNGSRQAELIFSRTDSDFESLPLFVSTGRQRKVHHGRFLSQLLEHQVC